MGTSGRKFSVITRIENSSEKAAKWAAFSVYALLAAWTLFQTSLLRPGVPAWDQFYNFKLIQLAHEGQPWPLRAMSGALYLGALDLSIWLFGKNSFAYFLPNLLLLGLESLLLWQIARQRFNPGTALGAVCFNLLSVYTLTRAGSLYSYVALPCELLFLILTIPHCRRPWSSLLWGMAAALVSLDYEGWIIGYPVLALAFWATEKNQRPSVQWVVLGLLLLGIMIIWQSRHWFEHYWVLRLQPQAISSGKGLFHDLGPHLKSFFWGGDDLYLGNYAAMPAWIWLPFAIGIYQIWRSVARWWLVWILCALPILATASNQPEAHRATAVWPALCLATGLGLNFLWDALRAWRLLRLTLLGLLLFFCMGSALDNRLATLNDERPYEHWDRIALASEILNLRSSERPIQILTDLNNRSMEETRFFLPKSSSNPKESWALISQDFLEDPPDRSLGSWVDLGPRKNSWILALLKLKPEKISLFEEREHFLRSLWQRIDLDGAPLEIQDLRQVLEDPNLKDPWLRQACLERLIHRSLELHQDPRLWLSMAMAEPRPGSWTLCMLAQAFEKVDPPTALKFAARSWAMNPSRAGLAALRDSLLITVRLSTMGLEPKNAKR
jgi:hypothetical protein